MAFNDAKRTILTKLFDSVTYKSNAVSVIYTNFVASIARRTKESKQIIKEVEILNRTNKKDSIDRGHSVEKIQFELLRPVWQGL